MVNQDNAAIQAALGALTSPERLYGVAYFREEILEAGDTYAARPAPIITSSISFLAFVDPSPSANWGHDCRYLVIDANSLAVGSQPARFPPFLGSQSDWSLIHRAPGIPDTLIHGSINPRGESWARANLLRELETVSFREFEREHLNRWIRQI
jgi:hypothetical protein